MYLKQNTILQGGRYKIVKYISSGGFGCTYEAVFTTLNKKVAIKEFFVKDFCNRDDVTANVSVATQSKVEIVDKLKKKFIDEAAAIWKFNHPNIVRVSDVFQENGTAYYVMDYINGLSLQAILKESGPLRENIALKYIRQVADALKYVHSLNRLHLDIKPGNIMIDEHDNAILIDFGASKQYNEQGENTSTLLGLNTVGYAPAEQMSRSFSEFNPAADVYALGATLYKLLTGITPPDSILLISGVEELKPLPTYISSATKQAITGALKAKRTERTQNVTDFVNALSNINTTDTVEEETKIDEDTTIIVDQYKTSKRTTPSAPHEESNTPPPTTDSDKKTDNLLVLFLGIIGLFIILIIGSYNGCSNQAEVPAEAIDSVYYDDTLVFDSACVDTVAVDTALADTK